MLSFKTIFVVLHVHYKLSIITYVHFSITSCYKCYFIQSALILDLGLVSGEQKNLRDKEGVVKAIRTAVMSKQYGNEDFLAKVIADACSM